MKNDLAQTNAHRLPCLTLIGMPAAGKSTLGELVAQRLGWAFIDSDKLIEALYGAPLQAVTDALGKEAFLDVESAVIQTIGAHRCVISTGGSVVYRADAMRHLADLGPVCHVALDLDVIIERINLKPDRGIAIAPGQTIEDLFKEREALYANAAQFVCDANGKGPDECVNEIMRELKNLGWSQYSAVFEQY